MTQEHGHPHGIAPAPINLASQMASQLQGKKSIKGANKPTAKQNKQCVA
jgi:hypothetical protein